MHVLVVDSDRSNRQSISDYLKLNGYSVHEAGDVAEMDKMLKSQPVQVVLLDNLVPGGNGVSLCRRLVSEDGPSVIVMSAVEDAVDRIVSLELGADDYVLKPINPRELLARIRVAMRRHPQAAAVTADRPSLYEFAGFRLNVVHRQLHTPGGDVLRLTPAELSVLAAFLQNRGEVLSRAALRDLAFRGAADVLDRAIDTQVSRLRRKLNAYSGVQFIRTVYGWGYLWEVASPAPRQSYIDHAARELAPAI